MILKDVLEVEVVQKGKQNTWGKWWRYKKGRKILGARTHQNIKTFDIGNAIFNVNAAWDKFG